MNLKTTFILVVLVGAGAGGWVWLNTRKPIEAPASETLTFLQTRLKADNITRIEVTRARKPLEVPYQAANVFGLLGTPSGCGPLLAASTQHPKVPATLFVLERHDKDWTLPGQWPVRPQETAQWFAVLTKLHTRFEPIALTDKTDLARYGLVEEPLTIKISFGAETRALQLGEEREAANRFTRSSFLRLDDKNEVIQLGPGVFAALNRSTPYFRQTRLFPFELAAKSDNSSEKVEQLDAAAVEVATKDLKFTLVKKGKDWILQDAYKKKEKDKKIDWQRVCSEDRIDPDRRIAFLRGFPDLWAEKFVDNKSLEECGLKEPESSVTVTKTGGGKIKLLIGKVSASKSSFEMKKGPPGLPPEPIATKAEWRFAKLQGNEQLFEIKADKLADIALDLDKLRDPRLVRFETGDVKRLEIQHGDQEIVLAKVKENDKEIWRFEKPAKDDADAKTVEDFLDKLTSLRARGDDIRDDIDLKTVGLDKPRGRVKIIVEETGKGAKDKDAKKKKRDIVLHIGVKAKEDGKAYVRVDAWPRVNEVGADLWKLASRSDLAYRQRELWHIEREAITRITIQSAAPPYKVAAAPYHLDHTKKGWKVSGPLEADVPASEINALADELADLKCDRFDAANVKDLARFGIGNPNRKPEFKITLSAKEAKPRVLEIGNQATPLEGGRYARSPQVGGGNTVFVLNDKFLAKLRKDPFDFLDKSLWKLDPADIQRIRFSDFALQAKKGSWQVVDSPVAPFAVDEPTIKKTIAPLFQLRADKYAAFGGKIDWSRYALAKPQGTVMVTLAGAKDKTKDHVVELGKEAPGGGRFARIDKKDAVVQLDAETVKALTHKYVDFAQRGVLKFDSDAVTAIERKMKNADFQIARQGDGYLMVKPGPRDADILTVADLLKKASLLQAERIAELAPKNLQPFGLDKPTAVVTIRLEAFDGSTARHVIKVGNAVKKDADERFARIDDKPAVIVLSAALSRHLVAPVLHFADRNLTDFSNVDSLELTRGERKAVFSRSDTGWKMTQPVEAGAEAAAVNDLIGSLQRLRADEIVADKGADMKKYGLDAPFLQWRVKGSGTDVHLIVGKPENDQPGARRYAKLGDKASVFLLSSKVTAKVQNEVANRAAWTPFKADAVTKLTVVNRGKSFVLNRKGATWELAGDAKAKVSGNDVANALNILESLKAARWVIDAKGDLKKYGLADPAWKIEIELGKDKHALWLGNYEDKSKRLYATVPGPPGAVFVVDEIDALILARPRSAYVEPAKKK